MFIFLAAFHWVTRGKANWHPGPSISDVGRIASWPALNGTPVLGSRDQIYRENIGKSIVKPWETMDFTYKLRV